jgi:hypothetical protein
MRRAVAIVDGNQDAAVHDKLLSTGEIRNALATASCRPAWAGGPILSRNVRLAPDSATGPAAGRPA